MHACTYTLSCRVVEKGIEEMVLDGQRTGSLPVQRTGSLPVIHPFFARDEGVDGP